MLVLSVARVDAATSRAQRVWLDLAGQTLAFRAGQSVELGTIDQAVRKPYSIACSPGEAERSGALEFLIQFDHQRGVSPHLLDLAPGRPIGVGDPAGSFAWHSRPVERHVLFVAGGTGIAPIRSMIGQAIEEGYRGRIVLVYSARLESDLAYASEFAALAREGRIEFIAKATREAASRAHGEPGRLDRRDLAPIVVDADTLCYLCGPASLVEEVPAILGALGVAPSRIRTESWRDGKSRPPASA